MIDIVADHESWGRPVKFGVYAFAEFHCWATCAVIDKQVGIEFE